MNEAVSSALEAYNTLQSQIDVIREQQQNLANIVFDDVKRRLSVAPSVSVPQDLIFAGSNVPPRGDWNRACWDLTDTFATIRMALDVVSAPLEDKTVEVTEDGSLILGGVLREQQISGRAKIPAWILDSEPDAIASLLAQKVQAAEAEKYPSN